MLAGHCCTCRQNAMGQQRYVYAHRPLHLTSAQSSHHFWFDTILLVSPQFNMLQRSLVLGGGPCHRPAYPAYRLFCAHKSSHVRTWPTPSVIDWQQQQVMARLPSPPAPWGRPHLPTAREDHLEP